MAHILVFGTSTTYGAWDTEGGWVSKLRKFIDQKVVESYDGQNHTYYHLIYNLGVSGDDTRGILKRFEQESKVRFSEDEETIIIFHVGVNDSQFRHKENNFKVPQGEYRNNLKKLIFLARQISSKIIFVGFNPVNDSKVNPIPWNLNESYSSDNILKYDNILKEICNEEKVHYIRVFNRFKEAGSGKLLEDGLHPNNEGHNVIYEIVKEYLLEKNLI